MISLLGLLTNCRSVYMETLYLLALVPRFRLIFAIIIIRYLLVHQHFSMLPHKIAPSCFDMKIGFVSYA